jgi:hypothetical protein
MPFDLSWTHSFYHKNYNTKLVKSRQIELNLLKPDIGNLNSTIIYFFNLIVTNCNVANAFPIPLEIQGTVFAYLSVKDLLKYDNSSIIIYKIISNFIFILLC